MTVGRPGMAEYHKHGAASFRQGRLRGRAGGFDAGLLIINDRSRPTPGLRRRHLDRKSCPDGGWKLGVHIADVAYFIPPGSDIDVRKDRCNSVYLPRRVIPMIPELLSNGICSLQEAFTASASRRS